LFILLTISIWRYAFSYLARASASLMSSWCFWDRCSCIRMRYSSWQSLDPLGQVLQILMVWFARLANGRRPRWGYRVHPQDTPKSLIEAFAKEQRRIWMTATNAYQQSKRIYLCQGSQILKEGLNNLAATELQAKNGQGLFDGLNKSLSNWEITGWKTDSPMVSPLEKRFVEDTEETLRLFGQHLGGCRVLSPYYQESGVLDPGRTSWPPGRHW